MGSKASGWGAFSKAYANALRASGWYEDCQRDARRKAARDKANTRVRGKRR